MATKTARFELINPYQKYGLKRRPTFNEILGLLSEDQKLLRPFPDRTATQFRNSPQGSFFDGSDHVELLTEQQNRVLDRQMREMILRKQAQENGGTFHLNRHNDSFTSEQSVSDSGMMTPSVCKFVTNNLSRRRTKRIGATSQRFSRKTTTGRAKAWRSS